MRFAMSIEFHLSADLTRFTEGTSELELEGATIRQALEHLWRRFPPLQSRVLNESGAIYPYLILLHNQQRVPPDQWDAALHEGDCLEIEALASGG